MIRSKVGYAYGFLKNHLRIVTFEICTDLSLKDFGLDLVFSSMLPYLWH